MIKNSYFILRSKLPLVFFLSFSLVDDMICGLGQRLMAIRVWGHIISLFVKLCLIPWNSEKIKKSQTFTFFDIILYS